MLKKLMKYELLATGRVFLPLYGALLLIAGFSWLLKSLGMSTPGNIGIVVSVILIVGIFVLTLVLTIQRFRQNLLSNEGHLMMTLPVKIDYLILSKLFVSAIWVVCSTLVVILAILLLAADNQSFSEIAKAFRQFGWIITTNAPQIILYAIETLVFIVVSILLTALILYACMSLSMLVNTRRGLFTFAAFIVITTAIQVLSAYIGIFLTKLDITYNVENVFRAQNSFMLSQLTLFSSLAVELIGCTVFYFITRYMLKNRLNLQ